eukprot:g25891.t1
MMKQYRKEIEGLVMWYNENNLSLNVSKTKELIIDVRNKGGRHINGAYVERVESVKFLGVTITDNLSWTSHVDVTVKKLLYSRNLVCLALSKPLLICMSLFTMICLYCSKTKLFT